MNKKVLISTSVFLLVCFAVLVSFSDVSSDAPHAHTITKFVTNEGSAEMPKDLSLSAPIEAQALSELEMNILRYELLVQTEGTAENHFRLASLYREAGMIKLQRDALERSFRLNQDEQTFELLQGVVVNVYEENSLLQTKVRNVSHFLGVEDAWSSAVELVTSEEWFAVMMPTLSDGKRNYYFEDATDKSTLYIEVGFDILNENTPFTRMWYKTPTDDNVVYLFQSGNMFQLLETTVINNRFDGEFTLWLCVVNGDMIYHDTGTFEQGVVVGDFVSRVYSNPAPTDLVSLFNYRYSVEYEVFVGNFDENGQTTVAQPQTVTGSQIAYALSEDGSRFLSHTVSEYEEREGFVFNYSFLSLTMQPDFEKYEPLPNRTLQGNVTLDLSEMQVRIFDSVIQWFDGENWHNMGEVLELLAQDPFRSIMTAMGNADSSGVAATSDNGGIVSPWINRGGASEVEPPRTAPATGRSPAGTSNVALGGGGSNGSGGGGGGSYDDWSSYTPSPPYSPSAPAAPAAPEPPPLPDGGGDGQDIGWSDTFT